MHFLSLYITSLHPFPSLNPQPKQVAPHLLPTMATLNSPFLLLLLAITTLFLHTTSAANVPASHPDLLGSIYVPIPPDDPFVVSLAKWAVENQTEYKGLVYSKTRCAEIWAPGLRVANYILLILAHQDKEFNFYEASLQHAVFGSLDEKHLYYFEKAPRIKIIPPASAFEKGSNADLQLK